MDADVYVDVYFIPNKDAEEDANLRNDADTRYISDILYATLFSRTNFRCCDVYSHFLD